MLDIYKEKDKILKKDLEKDLAVIKGSDKVLNAGCAYGWEARIIRKFCKKLICIDVNPYFVKRFKENNKGGYVVGDDLAYGTIGGFSQVEIPLYLVEFFREVYGSPEISKELIGELKQYNFTYIITHPYMTKFPCFFQFSDKFTQEELGKFDHSPYFNLVYNNSVIKIYEIDYASD